MACELATTEVVLEASTVNWGRENKSCIEPVLGLTGGESFLISTVSTNYQVWFDLDGVSTPPTPAAGETLVEVELTTGFTLVDMVDAIKLAVETAKIFYTEESIDGEAIVLEVPVAGAPLSALADVDSGFTLSEVVTGFNEDLGETAEGIEVSFESTLFDVTSNQRGTLVIDQILQGVTASCSMGLQEVSKSKLETIIAKGYGDSFTPAAGTSLVGGGTSKNFQSSFDSAGRLVLHPVRLPTSDRTEDFTFWKTVAQPESINYDGTAKKTLAVSFSALVDDSKPEAVSLYAVGDSEQYLA